MILTRINPHGMTFHLTSKPGDITQTRICYGNKFIHVNVTIDEMNASWYQWTMKGQLVQRAFPKLSPSEREFIMTAITPDEWNAMFKEIEE